MPTQANPGAGTKLQLKIASTYTTVAQRVSLSGPSREMGQVESSHLDSQVKTFHPTILDNGAQSGSLFYDPADPTHAALTALLTTYPPVLGDFKLILADSQATTYQYLGILTKLELNGMELETLLGADFEIKISGAITESHT